mgnify:CR=1 FL=1
MALATAARGSSTTAPAARQPTFAAGGDVRLADEIVDGAPLSESALAAHVARRAAELLEGARGGDAAACVSAAEFILVRQVEPPLSRELFTGVSTAEAVQIRQRVDAAMALLDTADKTLEADPGNDALKDELSERSAMARAFGRLFAALARLRTTEFIATASSPEDNPIERDVLEACRGLSVYLDDSRPAVAASARLWQAAAYRRIGRPERALQLLPRLAVPPQEWPFDYFSRLERLYALADHGEHVAALALAATLQRRIDDWVEKEHQEPARLTCARLNEALLRGWARRLDADGRAELARNANRDADEAARAAEAMTCGALRLGETYAAEAALSGPRAASRLFGVDCRAESTVLLLAPSGAADESWRDAVEGLNAFLRSLEPSRRFAIVSVDARGMRAFPKEGLSATARREIGRGEQFIGRVRNDGDATATLADGLRRAGELKPAVILVVTSDAGDADAIGAAVEALKEQGTRVLAFWIGSGPVPTTLSRLCAELNGEARRVQPSTQPDPGVPTEEETAP